MARWLIALGIVLVVLGVAWPWIGQPELWDWFGRLPGDVTYHGNGFTFYFPVTTSIVVSVALSILLWLWRKGGGE